MNRAAVLCLAAACFLSAGPAARASNINWSYHFVPDGHSVNFIHSNNAFGIVGLPGSGSGSHSSAPDSTTTISTKIWSFSTASASNPQAVNLPFAINLKITDHASGVSAYVSFSGALSGNIWKNGSSLNPTFSSPLTQAVDIDHHLYTITFKSFTPPEGTGHATGSFTFDVKVQHNPEPSTLVLAAIGVPFVGLRLRRRYRRRSG